MYIPHSFYEDEIRCDFLIPSMIKRTWAAQMEILADLDKACSDHGMEYFAEWGTLLGTVRHTGFIPWDDDMDICMKRPDYNRLTRDVASFLPDNYSIVNYRSSRDFKQMLSRVVCSDHYRFDPEFMHKYSGLPFAMGIDIFPLDFLTDDEEYERDREDRVNLVYAVANDLAKYDMPISSIEDDLKLIELKCNVSIDRNGDVLTYLRSLLEEMFGEVDEKDAKYITLYPIWISGHTYRFPKEYYGKSIRLPFENSSICTPVCYDAILRTKYGNSYMTPVRSGGAHEYPYYEEHVSVLRKHFGFEWPSYKFDPTDMAPLEDMPADTAGTRRCVFITYSSSAFTNMRRLVKKFADDGYDVTVHVASKFDIAPDMTGITTSADDKSDEYYMVCEGVKVSRDPSILNTYPDVIVTNYPYDEYNLITTVDKAYYSNALRGRTNRLIYVPPFEARSIKTEDERAIKLMPQYVCTPMIARCDEIILANEEIKDRYVECLSKFSGDKYRQYWEQKITVWQDSDSDRRSKEERSKKRILFYVGLSTFAECGVAAVDKIKRSFDIFEENRDKIEVTYKTQECLCDNLKKLFPDLYEKYRACDFRESVDEIIIDNIDAYYGEASVYATEALNRKVPVMIMNINC